MKIFFDSLGCDKTTVDSEHILGAFSESLCITDSVPEADIIAINTCCFIKDALEESINAIISHSANKKDNCKIVVFGCMAKRYLKDIRESLPEVYMVIPSTDTKTVIEAVSQKFKLDHRKNCRFIFAPGYYSYLKISDGCNKRCTYCVIPDIRGRYKSVPMDELVNEAKFLADSGISELIIVAQETTLYGIDLYGEKSLHILLSRLSEIDGITWIRLLYAYPEEIYDKLIYEIRDNPKILHYIDMPIQHCNDFILKSMGRRTDKKGILSVIDRLRSAIPDICIRTTLIVGFPGETKKEFEELCDFIVDAGFDRLGAFTYSREENTPAFHFKNQVLEDEKELRYDKIMRLQEKISEKKSEGLTGKVLRVIVDGYLPQEEVYVARSYRDAPEIDGMIFFNSDRRYLSGEFLDVKITDTFSYDLRGEVYEFTE